MILARLLVIVICRAVELQSGGYLLGDVNDTVRLKKGSGHLKCAVVLESHMPMLDCAQIMRATWLYVPRHGFHASQAGRLIFVRDTGPYQQSDEMDVSIVPSGRRVSLNGLVPSYSQVELSLS